MAINFESLPLAATIDQPEDAKEGEDISNCTNTPLRCSKSQKRKAAELALVTRFTPSESATSAQLSASKRSRRETPIPLQIRACEDVQDSQCLSSEEQGWCSFPISVQHTDWETGIARAKDQSQSPETLNFGDGTDILLVDQAKGVANAIKRLKDSMQDPVIGIDLEWKPEFKKGQALNPVALIQIASSSLAVLIRCKKPKSLPPALLEFFRDPSIVFVGYSWDSSDEKRFQLSFGAGKSSFAQFFDLQNVSASQGYIGYSLASLVQRIMHVDMSKTKTVSKSNWAANTLKRGQILYAALDAFMTGEAFRALRVLHSIHSICPRCKNTFGQTMPSLQLKCLSCKRDFQSYNSLQCHCKSVSHKSSVRKCEECGRTWTRVAPEKQRSVDVRSE